MRGWGTTQIGHPMARPFIAAIVPMRHTSHRAVGKNYRPFLGKPLFWWVMQTLFDSQRVDQIVVDTDSPTIREGLQGDDRVTLLERPDHLRASTVPMNDVLLNTVAQLDADLFVQTHSTNPFLRPETLDAAVDRFLLSQNTHDSAFSVARLQTRLWDKEGRPLNHNPHVLKRTQDLDPVFEESSTFYILSESTLKERHNRIGRRPLMIEVSPIEAYDIDDEDDFLIAEAIGRALGKGGCRE